MGETLRYHIDLESIKLTDSTKEKIKEKVYEFAEEVEEDDDEEIVFLGRRGGGNTALQMMENLFEDLGVRGLKIFVQYIEDPPSEDIILGS